MTLIKITQINTNMVTGKIDYYYEVHGENKAKNGMTYNVGYFTCSFANWEDIAKKNGTNKKEDIYTDAEVVRTAFKNKFDNFKIEIGGKDVTPPRKPMNQEIREELESKDYTLDELFKMLEEEQDLFKKSMCILRITAKFKTVVINELITKKFEDMEAEHLATTI